MINIVFLLFAGVLLSTTTGAPLPAVDVCQMSVCFSVDNCRVWNLDLSQQVKDKKILTDERIFANLVRNASSSDAFYLAMSNYSAKLNQLDKALSNYMQTGEFKQLSTSVAILDYVTKYKGNLIGLMKNTYQAIGEIEDIYPVGGAPAVSSAAPPSTDLNSLNAIYSETWYVTDRFGSLLTSWRNGCPVCAIV